MNNRTATIGVNIGSFTAKDADSNGDGTKNGATAEVPPARAPQVFQAHFPELGAKWPKHMWRFRWKWMFAWAAKRRDLSLSCWLRSFSRCRSTGDGFGRASGIASAQTACSIDC